MIEVWAPPPRHATSVKWLDRASEIRKEKLDARTNVACRLSINTITTWREKERERERERETERQTVYRETVAMASILKARKEDAT